MLNLLCCECAVILISDQKNYFTFYQFKSPFMFKLAPVFLILTVIFGFYSASTEAFITKICIVCRYFFIVLLIAGQKKNRLNKNIGWVPGKSGIRPKAANNGRLRVGHFSLNRSHLELVAPDCIYSVRYVNTNWVVKPVLQ